MHRNNKPCEEERRSVGMQEIRPSRRIGLGTNRESTSSSDREIQQLQAEGAAEAFAEDVEDAVLCAVVDIIGCRSASEKVLPASRLLCIGEGGVGLDRADGRDDELASCCRSRRGRRAGSCRCRVDDDDGAAGAAPGRGIGDRGGIREARGVPQGDAGGAA